MFAVLTLIFAAEKEIDFLLLHKLFVLTEFLIIKRPWDFWLHYEVLKMSQLLKGSARVLIDPNRIILTPQLMISKS